MKELQNIKEAFDALLSSFDAAGIKDNTYDEWAKNTKRRKPQQSKVELAGERREDLDAIQWRSNENNR
jgi:hypothetical protein